MQSNAIHNTTVAFNYWRTNLIFIGVVLNTHGWKHHMHVESSEPDICLCYHFLFRQKYAKECLNLKKQIWLMTKECKSTLATLVFWHGAFGIWYFHHKIISSFRVLCGKSTLSWKKYASTGSGGSNKYELWIPQCGKQACPQWAPSGWQLPAAAAHFVHFVAPLRSFLGLPGPAGWQAAPALNGG